MIPKPEPQPLSIALRAYAEHGGKGNARKWRDIGVNDDWVLVFDTETTNDHAQNLRFGVYQVYENDVLAGKGIFYNPDTIADDELLLLQQVASRENYFVITRDDFIEKVFLKIAYQLKGLVVGLNLPFDLSRLAIHHANARKRMHGGFTFQLSKHDYQPWVQIKYLSRHSSIIKFRRVGTPLGRSQRKRKKATINTNGYFLDIGTIAWSLTDKTFTLKRLAEHLDTEHRKEETDDHGGPLTTEYIRYAIMDTQVTWECYIKLRERYALHGLKTTAIQKVFSGAGLGKAYLEEMGIKSWRDCQPDFPPKLLGIIMSSYFGGRSEVRIRLEATQVAYCDFLSMYPTVCTLMGLWKWVIAQGVTYTNNAGTREQAQKFVDELQISDLKTPTTWKELCTLVQIMPDADLVPVRAKYDLLSEGTDASSAAQYTIGLNYLTSDIPVWITLADCIAAKLVTGKSPVIIQAISFNHKEPQENLCSIEIMGNQDFKVNPYSGDFYRQLIELRSQTKKIMRSRTGHEKESLDIQQGALKILANATSYGIFLQLNVDELYRKKIITCHDYSGSDYPFAINNLEKPGQYYHPLMGTFITGAARLMLAIAERLGADAGLDWVFCDTDSMAFAKPSAMSQAEFGRTTADIRDWFDSLNPYSSQNPIFKLEDINFTFDKSDILEPLYCIAVSAKRYVMFNIDPRGNPYIRKGSAHGLGHLIAPYKTCEDRPGVDAPIFPIEKLREETGLTLWQHDIWLTIIKNSLANDGRANPASAGMFDQPAVRKYAATTPELLRWFSSYNKDKPYSEQVKPFNFMLAFKAARTYKPRVIHADEIITRKAKPSIYLPSVVAPYDSDLKRGALKAFDRKTGKAISVDELETYKAGLAQYHLHPEAKFLDSGYFDVGVTRRRHIEAIEISSIGKEANRLEERTELEERPDAQISYGASAAEDERLLKRFAETAKTSSKKEVAEAAGITPRALYDILSGNSKPHASTRARIRLAIVTVEREQQHQLRLEQAFISWAEKQIAVLKLDEQKIFAESLGTNVSDLRKMISGTRSPSKKAIAKFTNREA